MNHPEKVNKAEKKYTPSQAREKIQSFCVYRERSQHEVRQRLYEYGLHSKDVEHIISELIQSNFLNEERFARAFVRGKFAIKKWGRVKINHGLRQHKLSDYILKKAFDEIEEEEYIRTLKTLFEKKRKEVKEKDEFRRNGIIAQWLVSKGYEQDLVWETVKSSDM